MSRPIVFLDTETTGLHPDRRVWEVAMIHRRANGVEQTLSMLVSDVDLTSAELIGLNIGRFYERHPRFNHGIMDEGVRYVTEAEAARYVEEYTRNAIMVGAVPSFDAGCLAPMLRRHNLVPAWHYQLQDVESVALGWYIGNGGKVELPIKSDELSRLCGVEPPTKDRHTALGDARWVRDWWDAVTRGGLVGGTS